LKIELEITSKNKRSEAIERKKKEEESCEMLSN